MKKRKFGKYIVFTLALTVICTAVLFMVSESDVFGKFVSKEPYIEEGSNVSTPIVVTSEGSNQKGKAGSGAAPCSEEVPTCVGKKGSETNPFVILEIVPDKGQQQLAYLAGDEESGLPYDPMEMSIEVTAENGDPSKTMFSGQSLTDLGFRSALGFWFVESGYPVYKIGTSEKESENLSYADKYYTVPVKSSDIKEAGYDTEQFNQDYNSLTMTNLIKKYPKLFVKDNVEEDTAIKEAAKKDDKNWKKSYEKKVKAAERMDATSGYFVITKGGEGDFFFNPGNNYIGTDDSWLEDYHYKWVYSEEKPENGIDILSVMDRGSIDNIVNKNNDQYVNYYLEVTEGETYKDVPLGRDEIWDEYTFEYYGLKVRDILKRSLFKFSDEEDYENFHMKVICMTPAELNKISEKDTDDTVDMIERADMFYISTYSYFGAKAKPESSDDSDIGEDDTEDYDTIEERLIDGTESFYKFYNNWVEGDKDYSFNQKKDVTRFYENDLEWSSCMKIIKRVSENKNLPLMYNKAVGTILNQGVTQGTDTEECMYISDAKEDYTHAHRKGSLNNISKLYLISVQFDLMARKSSGGYSRTFMEDIYNSIQTVSLSKETLKDAAANTAKTTGYYVRKPALNCPDEKHAATEYQERANYLWNTCTFYPEEISVNMDGGFDQETIDRFINKGYLATYFPSFEDNPLNKDSLSGHETGVVPGEEEDVDRNVTVVTNGNANINMSTFLNPTGGNGNTSADYLDLLHIILNTQTATVEDMSVAVQKQKKQYVKLSDSDVLIDYNSKAAYNDKTLYLKVLINTNGNNLPGVVTAVRLKNETTGKSKTLKLYQSTNFADAGAEVEKKTYSDSNGAVSGYVVDGSLIAYIPYSLLDWTNGYQTMELDMCGRIYNTRKKKNEHGEVVTASISIAERTLFNLE